MRNNVYGVTKFYIASILLRNMIWTQSFCESWCRLLNKRRRVNMWNDNPLADDKFLRIKSRGQPHLGVAISEYNSIFFLHFSESLFYVSLKKIRGKHMIFRQVDQPATRHHFDRLTSLPQGTTSTGWPACLKAPLRYWKIGCCKTHLRVDKKSLH